MRVGTKFWRSVNVLHEAWFADEEQWCSLSCISRRTQESWKRTKCPCSWPNERKGKCCGNGRKRLMRNCKGRKLEFGSDEGFNPIPSCLAQSYFPTFTLCTSVHMFAPQPTWVVCSFHQLSVFAPHFPFVLHDFSIYQPLIGLEEKREKGIFSFP